MLLALFVLHRVEADIRVAEGAADTLGSLGDLAGGGEQLLLSLREDVRGAAADLINAAAVGLQLGLHDVEEVQPVLVERHNLGRGEGGRAGDRDPGARGLAAHVLIKAVGGVAVGRTAGIAVQRRQAQLQLVLKAEILQQRLGALAEAAAERGKARGHLLQGLVFRPPGLIARVHVAQIPGVLFRDLAAFGDTVFCHAYTSCLSGCVILNIIARSADEYNKQQQRIDDPSAKTAS